MGRSRKGYRIEYSPETVEHFEGLTARDATTLLDVEEEPERVVKIRAVGIKERNRVRIGGEEVELR